MNPGDNWDIEIKNKLHAAHIVLMLVNANFLTTNYIWNIEVQDTFSRQEKGEVAAIPAKLKAFPHHPVLCSPLAIVAVNSSSFTSNCSAYLQTKYSKF